MKVLTHTIQTKKKKAIELIKLSDYISNYQNNN